MPIEPVKIPQNVHIEDRIIGPLSLRQIMIIAIGGGFSYALYSSLVKAYGQIGIPITIIVWVPALIATAFALVRINDLSLMRICFLTMERMSKAPVRTWAPRTGISINIRIAGREDKNAKQRPPSPSENPQARKIRELSSLVDTTFSPALDANQGDPTTVDPGEPQKETSPSTTTDHEDHDFLGDIPPEVEGPRPPSLPVNPNRIAVDQKSDKGNPFGLSDLSVFRDVFPPSR
ncbi:PrgI family protein [Candidatus Peregrinibacteria bacterium]|nr:PrgI family protein [Candidatus Peregrinibacteria bacterium]